METFSSLFKKEHMGELILIIILIIYLILGLKMPESIANIIDTLVGKIIIFIIIIYLFLYANPILAILALFTAFDLIRRSTLSLSESTLGLLQKYAPTEIKEFSPFSAHNQFPYTLEQEVVAKMAPMVKTGCSLTPAPYKPNLDNTHDAYPLVNNK